MTLGFYLTTALNDITNNTNKRLFSCYPYKQSVCIFSDITRIDFTVGETMIAQLAQCTKGILAG